MDENEEAKQEMDELREKHPTLVSAVEDFVLAFERIADALEGIRVVAEKYQSRNFPDRKPVREANFTRVLTEEDKLRETQGASQAPDSTSWLEEFGDPEDLGVRERAFIEARVRRQGSQGPVDESGSQ